MTGVGPVEAGVALGARTGRLEARQGLPRSRRLARLGRRRDAGTGGSLPGDLGLLSRHGRLAARLREGRDALSRPAGDRAAAVAHSRRQGGEPVDRRQRSSPAPPMRPSPPTWWRWKPSRCCAPASCFGMPLIGLRGISDGSGRTEARRRLDGISARHRREAGGCGRCAGTGDRDGRCNSAIADAANRIDGVQS